MTMENSFLSVSEAEKAFKESESWTFARTYFRGMLSSVAVCLSNGRYFIITHPMCVEYRRKQGQVVKMIY